MTTGNYDVLVVGGGPAGLAAAISAHDNGAKVLLLEREARLGGILKQCIHDGFGLHHFGEQLSGPEYAERFEDELYKRNIEYSTLTFVTKIDKNGDGSFSVHTVGRSGVSIFTAKALVLATGCRERTAKQVFIHGTRPAGVFTAGTAQHFTNLLGLMPAKKCVILGSGDIGLIMARGLRLRAQRFSVFMRQSLRRRDLRETCINACTIMTFRCTCRTPSLACSELTGSKQLRFQRLTKIWLRYPAHRAALNVTR